MQDYISQPKWQSVVYDIFIVYTSHGLIFQKRYNCNKTKNKVKLQKSMCRFLVIYTRYYEFKKYIEKNFNINYIPIWQNGYFDKFSRSEKLSILWNMSSMLAK